MEQKKRAVAEICLEAAGTGGMTFPQIVQTLIAAGFESYLVDFRRAAAIYYQPDGDSVELPMHRTSSPIAPTLNIERMVAAVREAQQNLPGYTYRGFCEKVASAGCAGYLVSLSGRRVLYFARTAETHAEQMP